jgi:predicted nucleic acid-binding protein
MIPLRLVIDTNVVVSAALKPDGLQRTVVLLAMSKPARWYVSDPIVSEYAMVAQVTSDPADNMFIECADAARADYLVTGNQRHFPKFWKNTKIISSSEFLSVIAPHLLR